jgi:UDP-N-acetylmuramoyl-tripeptide--D-alanyl-D-alanine ligase
MIKTFFSLYTPKLPIYFVYMLQQVEYEPKKFLSWIEEVFGKRRAIQTVMQRKSLVLTSKATTLLVFSYTLYIALFVAAFMLADPELSLWFYIVYFIGALFVSPYVLVLNLTGITALAWILFVSPSQNRLIKQSKLKLDTHKGTKVAIIGSYGKTTMKELVGTILKEGKNVRATPGNMNTAYSQAKFIRQLEGSEEVLLFEFGEGKPGDVEAMTATIQPDYAVITGLAPNHLDKYTSLDMLADDLLAVYKKMPQTAVFANNDSFMLKKYLKKSMQTYSSTGVMGWNISNVLVSVTETTFTMTKGKKRLDIATKLIGRHQVAAVGFGAALADMLGLTKKQIETGSKNIAPFEHRMQPRNVGGAWIIDDTYNGNLEGLQAGLKLLEELDFARKWYVTPGLVDQGQEMERVHKELGRAIASAQPDIVVLMENSVRPIIEKAMYDNDFRGELRVETHPLDFYLNIEHVIAAGDIVLMQNDWTDNYN